MQQEGDHLLEPRIRRFPLVSSDSSPMCTHTIFLFIYIPNFLYSPYLIPFLFISTHHLIHPISKPDPQFPNPVTDRIPSSKPGDLRIGCSNLGRVWDVRKATIEEKTLAAMERAGDGVTGWYFRFHHFLISFQYYFSIFSMVFPSFY